METPNKTNEFIEKVNQFKSLGDADLSSGEDLSIAIMNLISIEEHLYFTAMKTNKKKYFELLGSARSMRTSLMRELIKQPEGELWCISKHLLGASMRLIEVGTKYMTNNKEREANEKFGQAFDLYSLFWGLNLNPEPLKTRDMLQDNYVEKKQKISMFTGIRELVKKIVDCCKE